MSQSESKTFQNNNNKKKLIKFQKKKKKKKIHARFRKQHKRQQYSEKFAHSGHDRRHEYARHLQTTSLAHERWRTATHFDQDEIDGHTAVACCGQ